MGLREWWDKMMGKGGDEYQEKTGLAEPSEDELDEYHSDKADKAAEQRDPGIMRMGSGDE